MSLEAAEGSCSLCGTLLEAGSDRCSACGLYQTGGRNSAWAHSDRWRMVGAVAAVYGIVALLVAIIR